MRKGRRTTKYDVRSLGESVWEQTHRAVLALMRGGEGGTTAVRLLPGGQIAISRVVVSENLLGEQETKTATHVIDASALEQITATDGRWHGRTVYAGNASGRLRAGSWTKMGRYRFRRSWRPLPTGAP